MDPADLTNHIVALTQKVEMLRQDLHDVKLENQNLRALLAQTTSASATGAERPEPKVLPPEPFSGNRKHFRDFLNACSLMFDLKPRTYFNDHIKVCTLISYLKGEARSWANTYLERRDPIINSYAAFTQAMALLFEDSTKQITADNALRALKQGKRPVEDYVVEFRRWAPDAQWNDVCLRNQFRLGLSETLKDELARTDLPPTLEATIQLAISVDRRLHERRSERPSTSSESSRRTPGPRDEPMEISTVRGPLSSAERERCRSQNLCLYCAAAEHTITQCPSLKRKETGKASPSTNLLPLHPTHANLLSLPLTLQWRRDQVSTRGLIDSGACGNFIHVDFVQKHRIPTVVKPTPLPVRLIDGSSLSDGPVTRQTLPLRMTIGPNHQEYVTFDVIPSPLYPVLLGQPWLKCHNPRIDWTNQRVSLDSPSCTKFCSLSHVILQVGEVQLPHVYKDFVDVFNKSNADTLPPHRSYDCPIDLLPGAKLPSGRVYPLSQPELCHLKQYLEDNLKKGFIRPSSSPVASGIFFVRNKDGSLWPIIDYREMNKITIKNRYPLPLIPELIERLQSARYYTKLDLKGAYNLIRMRSGDEWKTAFRTRYGLYEYLVMPFGLANAPATFQYFINDIFRDLLDTCVVVYLDDILIYSNSLPDHHKHVRWVLTRLREHRLYAKLEKCVFNTTTISFLGYVISPQGCKWMPPRLTPS